MDLLETYGFRKDFNLMRMKMMRTTRRIIRRTKRTRMTTRSTRRTTRRRTMTKVSSIIPCWIHKLK